MEYYLYDYIMNLFRSSCQWTLEYSYTCIQSPPLYTRLRYDRGRLDKDLLLKEYTEM